MKKIVVYLVITVLLLSCTESMQYNNEPRMQALMDNVKWEAFTSSATAAIANISIVGIGDNQSVTLKMKLPDDFVMQTDESTYIAYTLGTGNINQAFFAKQVGGKNYMYETKKGIGDGEIVITNYDGVTISGTFRFNAINSVSDSDQEMTVNFNKGVFYKIPITFN